MKTKKIRLRLTHLDRIKLETLSNEHRRLYNYLLGKVKEDGVDFKKIDQNCKNFRKDNQLTINAKSAQNTSRILINNIKSFFSLHKKDKSARFPKRFKSWKYFTSFTYDFNKKQGGFKLRDNHLVINKLLDIELVDYSEDINEDNIKTVTFKREGNNYYVMLVYAEERTSKKYNQDNFISIDPGVSNIITATSNKIDNFQVINTTYKKLEKKIENIQSLRDQHKKGSRRYKKLNELYKRKKLKLTNKRKDYHHKLSRKIVNVCKENDIGKIIIGDLNVKKLKKEFKCKLNKSTQNTGLSRFMTYLEYKSKNDNIDYQKINEAWTSQRNCLTGKKEFKSDLSIRKVEIKPGLIIDRDLNSAINIANKHLGYWLSHLKDFNLYKMLLNEHSTLVDWRNDRIYNFL